MTKRLKLRDLEWVERSPRRDSSASIGTNSSTSSPQTENLLPPQTIDLDTNLPSFLLPLYNLLTMPGCDKEKIVPKEEYCQSCYSLIIRLLHGLMSIVLTYVGLNQTERHDAAVWIPIFFVPAGITFLTAIRVHYVATIWVKATVSVYFGSAFFFLIWLLSQTLISMVETYEEGMGLVNPVEFQTGRDALAVACCIGWQKFNLKITKEEMSEISSSPHYVYQEVSPVAMLKRVMLMMLLPGALGAFCYIESVRPAIASTSEVLRSIVVHPA